MKVADIDPDRLGALNAGVVESAVLAEGLAIDFAALAQACLPDFPPAAIARVEAARRDGISRRMALMGDLLVEHLSEAQRARLAAHASDTVRGWACFAIAAVDGPALFDRLAAVRPLANDPHFGVREWAWLAVRRHLAAALDDAIAALTPWTDEPSERLRRFASEATRPRGVWCAHIAALKRAPEQGLPILEPLRADPSGYVQDSVGNWLNDAAKDRPDWVRALCARWVEEGDTPATRRISKRALRSIGSKPNPAS